MNSFVRNSGKILVSFTETRPTLLRDHILTPLAAAIIRHPNVCGPGCGFEVEGYPYQPGQFPSSGLPNLITNLLYAPAALNYEAACPDDSVQFWASSAGDPAGLRWDFGEPASIPRQLRGALLLVR